MTDSADPVADTPAHPRNLVICCDGTSNAPGPALTNVMKLFRVLDKDAGQLVFYDPGVGAAALVNVWAAWQQKAGELFQQATGAGLDANILAAYRFVCTHYRPGDRIFLFGFSRGAYTVRVVAGMLKLIGLLAPNQLNLAPYALKAYKAAGQGDDNLKIGWDFAKAVGARPAPVHFIGVWDTVASVIIPLTDRLFMFGLQMLPYTRKNPAVAIFRQAIAIDERRRLFRLNRWDEPQEHVYPPFAPPPHPAQDIRQVWFAGAHADVGGGYPEAQSALAKYPLIWLAEEAVAAGLRIDRRVFNHIAWGLPRPGGTNTYVAPSPTGPLHPEPVGFWCLFEIIPKRVKWREWKARPSFLGWYLPLGEPRVIADDARVHASAVARWRSVPDYRPVNFDPDKAHYRIEPMPQHPTQTATPNLTQIKS